LGQILEIQFMLAHHGGISISESEHLSLPELFWYWNRFVEETTRASESNSGVMDTLRGAKDALLEKFSFTRRE